MRNTGLDEAQAGIKIAKRNINNLRYADGTTLMAESEEEIKSLLMKVKVESEKVCLKVNIQKMKIMAINQKGHPETKCPEQSPLKLRWLKDQNKDSTASNKSCSQATTITYPPYHVKAHVENQEL